MTKIKYAEYGKFGERATRRRLYKHRIPVPGVIGSAIILSLALAIIATLLWETGTGNEVSGSLFGVAGIMFVAFGFAGMIGSDECNASRMFLFWVYLNPKPLPEHFHPSYVNNSYYQEALQEHMNGKYIGSLKPLNDALSQQTENDVKTDIVARLAAIARDEAGFMQLIGPKDEY